MAIRSIAVQNVMVFRGDSFKLDFSPGVNVLTGENGAGKTTLLKMIYAAIRGYKSPDFLLYFASNLQNPETLKSAGTSSPSFGYTVAYEDGEFQCDFSQGSMDIYGAEELKAVMIPATEMLSHSRGFLAMADEYYMPFDNTQIDIIRNAQKWERKTAPRSMQPLLAKLGETIGGEVIQEDDRFYIRKTSGVKVEFTLEAEGMRKLGLLWLLIRKGILDKDCVLLWDEPEANLNPELFSVAADVLLELARGGMQIFLTTHSYNFAKYLEIRRKNKETVTFHNLYLKREPPFGIACVSGYEMEDSDRNSLIAADNRLLDESFSWMKGTL